MNEREPEGRRRALQDLGAWPIRRDGLTAERIALIGAAWRAGNRNVAELARVADVTRDIVYSDLRSLGIEPTDPEQKKEPTVSPTVQKQQTARARLFAEMERLFADDAGLGVLVKYNGRPDLSDEAKALQTAWARALISVHGHDRAASVYTQYQSRRQKAVTEPIGSWKNLVLNTKPISYWSRDIHGFLCCICGDAHTSVVIDGMDDVCNRCARENSTVEDAQPQWHAYSHHHFIFPGLLREEKPKGETAIVIRYGDGETRDYITGEAGLLSEETTSLPGFTRVSGQTHGESRDTINLTIQARTERERRSFDILATFTYDPKPEGYDGHPYGFRFVSARLTPHHRGLGQVNQGGAPVIEYTDLYQLLDALVTGLYQQ